MSEPHHHREAVVTSKALRLLRLLREYDISPTVPFEEIEACLLTDPATKVAYDALEPAYQIARLRIEAGLTQTQLAALVGTKQPSIARLERSQ